MASASENRKNTIFFDSEIEAQFQNLVKTANQNIIFVTPYVELWGHLRDQISDAVARKVEVTFVIREDNVSHKQEELDWLHDHKVKVYQVPSLHAKIYLNEKELLVSSMNITRSSTRDSKDFAIAIRNQDDARKFRDYVSRLLLKGSKIQISQSVSDHLSRTAARAGGTSAQSGFCIRSGHKIKLDIDKPFCLECFHEWDEYQNEDYPEKYCHSCGQRSETTYAKPLCRNCWKKFG